MSWVLARRFGVGVSAPWLFLGDRAKPRPRSPSCHRPSMIIPPPRQAERFSRSSRYLHPGLPQAWKPSVDRVQHIPSKGLPRLLRLSGQRARDTNSTLYITCKERASYGRRPKRSSVQVPLAACLPAMRPMTRHSVMAQLPSLQAPWMPPVTSPAA